MDIPPYLLNEYYDDRYFDVVDAIAEANLVFFGGNRIIERLSQNRSDRPGMAIGETGFGAGRTLVALMDLLDRSGFRNLEISYYTVELHPITVSRMESILAHFKPELSSYIDDLTTSYGALTLKEHDWNHLEFRHRFGVLTCKLWIGDALEMTEALPCPIDAWFLDGHGPKKNPQMWREELLLSIGNHTAPGGTCATYTVAGSVRRGLTAAGFRVVRAPGFGGKKSVLRAERS